MLFFALMGLQSLIVGNDVELAPNEWIDAEVTAYCPCEKCCGRFADGLTASGKPAVGLIVAAPPEYPFGTVMDIPGYGVATVEDRGGVIKGNKLDVFFGFDPNSSCTPHEKALQWGRKILNVKVYKGPKQWNEQEKPKRVGANNAGRFLFTGLTIIPITAQDNVQEKPEGILLDVKFAGNLLRKAEISFVVSNVWI